MNRFLNILMLGLLCASPIFAQEVSEKKDTLRGDRIFEVDIIHEVRISFLQCDPWDSLFLMKKERDSLEIKKYMQANVEVNGVKFYSSGVRIKGESSFEFYPGKKKSLKINFGKYIKKQKLDGLKTINLNNAFRDPSFIREKLYLDFMRKEGLPVPRCTYANVYVNGEYMGLYSLVEEINKGFLNRNFQNKKGAFFKGEPKASFEFLGDQIVDYQSRYRNKKDSIDGFSELIDLIKVVNGKENGAQVGFNEMFNIEDCLKIFAITNLFVNIDAYNIHYPHNFYLYRNMQTGKFEWIPYDGNYAFCAFSPEFNLEQAQQLDIFYQYEKKNSPLMKFILANPEYRKFYLDYINYLLDGKFSKIALGDEIDKLVLRIRRSVYYDTHKMYSNEDFEKNINETIGDHNDVGAFVPGLKSFLDKRIDFLNKELKN